MSRRIGPFLAWVVATLLSILLANYAVSSVRAEVTDRPSPLQSTAATAGVLDSTSTSVAAPTTVSTSSPSDSTVNTTDSATAVTTTTPAVPSTTTTGAPAPQVTTTTTTAAPDSDYYKSYQLVGGLVRLRVVDNKVYLVRTVPASGYTVEVEKDGPESVELEFHNGEHESIFKAAVVNGKLEVDKHEEGD